MILAGYQPQYFPRLHYLNRVLSSDIFEVSDYVQFVKKHAFPMSDGTSKRGVSYQGHTPIKLSHGEQLLVIPTYEEIAPINKTKIVYSHDWAGKHIKSIEVGYRKSPGFHKYFPEIEKLLTVQYENLCDLTLRSVLWAIVRLVTDDPFDLAKLTWKNVNNLLEDTKHPFRLKRIFLASESGVPVPQKNETNNWIIALCKYARATEYYYGGTSHTAYMDNDKIEKAGIQTVLQEWICPKYPQQYMTLGFLPNLSVIDLVMNEDLTKRQEIMR